jgi:lysophospholipase L1-like esterase
MLYGQIKKYKNNILSFIGINLCFLIFLEVVFRLFFRPELFLDGPGSINRYYRASYYRRNREGFRDVEHSVAKGKNVIRILLLGDSYTAGQGIIDINNVFAKIIENKLNHSGSSHIYETINLGIGGYNTNQELNLLKDKGLKNSPDIIIVGYVLDDVDAGGVKLKQGLINKFLHKKLSRWLLSDSYFFYFLLSRLNKIEFKVLEKNIIKQFNNYYDSHLNPSLKKHCEDIKELIKLCEDRHMKLMFVIHPYYGVIDRKDYPLRNIHKWVNQEIIKNNGKVIDILNYKQRFAGKGDEFIVNPFLDIHPNELAHQIIADIIYENLIEFGYIKD